MSKEYTWNKDEEKYFECFLSKLSDEEKKCLKLNRLSTGHIEPYFNSYPLGKIKLQGRKHSMQILKSLYKFETIEGNVDDFIERIDDVITYLRKYCK
ncbi:hypothetical protein LI208_14910 [Longicatena sp. 210702-DFI.1.36]|uniref:hypothetical protein n=1 Tax=Bacillota TaxID=1239 RepID=UPI001D0814C6|nr:MULTISPECIES: hypothetical protein [Longicatena]MCB6265495.1 hypothetical protein [Longicatena sp. 210702-DFI.1.160]MCB6317217.1 hypothetical protein [Longicatena sp. 210702-DFI.1.100]MCB6431110.1 hypothetical protein [Longicatena sp. 210702-DFI.1.36]MCB6433022.1 hypothetical protein [Longicatena sp. 210702-DFI.1.249]MCB6440647.1 hypothetical protein [Longicatena sp. 210702-DFI.1.255]